MTPAGPDQVSSDPDRRVHSMLAAQQCYFEYNMSDTPVLWTGSWRRVSCAECADCDMASIVRSHRELNAAVACGHG